MTFEHDEIDDLPGSPDEPASPEEAARARAFSRLVDDLVAGKPLLMDADAGADTRSLIDTAAIMRANLRPSELAPVRMNALIDDVLTRARASEVVSETASDALSDSIASDVRPESDAQAEPTIIDLAARRAQRGSRLVRYAPWALSAIAAAAALLFALRTPAPNTDRGRVEHSDTQLSMIHRSRPADPLVGQIPRARADRASDRMDIIYADRMAGYRDLTLRGGRR